MDKMEGRFELTSTTALFYLEKDTSFYPKGGFHNI